VATSRLASEGSGEGVARCWNATVLEHVFGYKKSTALLRRAHEWVRCERHWRTELSVRRLRCAFCGPLSPARDGSRPGAVAGSGWEAGERAGRQASRLGGR